MSVGKKTLRELWLMACGRMQAIRQHVVWQAGLIGVAFKQNFRFDVDGFIRNGRIEQAEPRRVIMSPKLREQVEALQRQWALEGING